MNSSDYAYCARRIVSALKLAADEHILLKLDPRTFSDLVEPLQKEIRQAGAVISSVILAEDTTADSPTEFDLLRSRFAEADVFIWLPERHQGHRPALQRALIEWLDQKRGRAVHFHWQSGSYPIGVLPLPPQDVIDRIYLEALSIAPEELETKHRQAIEWLRRGAVHITTPDGTDLRFEVSDRPFCSQIGDASRDRMQDARTRIDRDIELPAGVLRVAPIESSVNGTVFLPVWKPLFSEGCHLVLHFRDGFLHRLEGENAPLLLDELTAAGGAARMFREFALGFNPALAIREDHPFFAYYGYGSGVVRLSLGDSEEMGGANRGGGVYWNFIANATVFDSEGRPINS